MATTKPRVQVSLSPEAYVVLKDLASMNHQSVSSVISGALDAMMPTIERVVEAGRRFELLSAEMRERVQQNFTAAEARVLPVVEELKDEMVDLLGLFEGVDNVELDPRPVTRGSRPPLSMSPPQDSGPST
jgi:uncharacterized protein (DUF1778 family)